MLDRRNVDLSWDCNGFVLWGNYVPLEAGDKLGGQSPIYFYDIITIIELIVRTPV